MWPNRYSNPVALHSVALHFPGFGGASHENRATPPDKGAVAPTFSDLKDILKAQRLPGFVLANIHSDTT